MISIFSIIWLLIMTCFIFLKFAQYLYPKSILVKFFTLYGSRTDNALRKKYEKLFVSNR